MATPTATRWGSRFAFVFAASSAAIGLGNIWRFPYLTGQHGGGTFVLLYLLCVIILGIPLLLAEIVLGRITRRDPIGAVAHLAEQSKRTSWWCSLSVLAMLTAFLVLTYYAVIVGWVLDYLYQAVLGHLRHITTPQSQALFAQLQAHPGNMILTTSIVFVLSMVVIVFGIKRGLERAVEILFPALFLIMLVLLIYAMMTGDFHQALRFLFKPDLSKITGRTFLVALGQAFFSLNIAMAVTIMFSAYLPKEVSLTKSAIAIALADTLFALLAGLIIFPVVFEYHLKPGVGPSLIFETLPIAFAQMPGGYFFSILFFLMLFFAAFTSVIGLIEPAVYWLKKQFSLSRRSALLIVTGVAWVLSFGSVFSFSHPEHLSWKNITFFHAIDFLTSGILLPVGGILLALFTGWVLKKKLMTDELGWNPRNVWYRAWIWILKYFAPVAIVLVLLSSLHVL